MREAFPDARLELLLAGMKDRARMWLLGGAFVAASGLVYLLILGAWLNLLLLAGLTTTYARWSNAIGGVALLAVGAALIFRPEWLAFG